jgi:ATP-dependent Clp protease ATP-binding subunit ClpB
LIQDPLALKILEGEVLHGDHVVVDADVSKRQMVFTVSGRTEAKPVGTHAK